MRQLAKRPETKRLQLSAITGLAAFQRHRHLSLVAGFIGLTHSAGHLNTFERGIIHMLKLSTAVNTVDGYIRNFEFDPMEKVPAAIAALVRYELTEVDKTDNDDVNADADADADDDCDDDGDNDGDGVCVNVCVCVFVFVCVRVCVRMRVHSPRASIFFYAPFF
jgi:hypothetical protein